MTNNVNHGVDPIDSGHVGFGLYFDFMIGKFNTNSSPSKYIILNRSVIFKKTKEIVPFGLVRLRTSGYELSVYEFLFFIFSYNIIFCLSEIQVGDILELSCPQMKVLVLN